MIAGFMSKAARRKVVLEIQENYNGPCKCFVSVPGTTVVCLTMLYRNNRQNTGAKNNQHYLYAFMFDYTNNWLCTLVDIRAPLFLITTPIRIYIQ